MRATPSLLLTLCLPAGGLASCAPESANSTDYDCLISDLTFSLADLSTPWVEGPLYNKNEGYCSIQSAALPNWVRGYAVIQDGFLVAEGYTGNNDATTLNPAYSITKSWTTMIMGKLVEQDKVQRSDTLGEIFNQEDDWVGVEDASVKQAVTVDEVLTMTSGLKTVENADLEGQETLQQVLNYWVYSPSQKGRFSYLPSNHILSRIITRRAGMTPKQFEQSTGIFESLGMIDGRDYAWETFGGVEGSAFGFSTTPRSLAKLGQLYLQKGFAANDFPLISFQWVEESAYMDHLVDGDFSSSCLSTTIGEYYGYGFQWYVDKNVEDDKRIRPEFEGSFSANGRFGQQIVVLPRINTVIAIMAYDPTLVLYQYAFLFVIVDNLPNLSKPSKGANKDQCGFSVTSFASQTLRGFTDNLAYIWSEIIVDNSIFGG